MMNGLDYFYQSGHPLENLHVLSSCHFLVSPPSTYLMPFGLLSLATYLYVSLLIHPSYLLSPISMYARISN